MEARHVHAVKVAGSIPVPAITVREDVNRRGQDKSIKQILPSGKTLKRKREKTLPKTEIKSQGRL